MKHYIHKVTIHYGGKAASASITPNRIVNSDDELEKLRMEYQQTYHAHSITFTASHFDGNLNEEQIQELKNILKDDK